MNTSIGSFTIKMTAMSAEDQDYAKTVAIAANNQYNEADMANYMKNQFAERDKERKKNDSYWHCIVGKLLFNL